MNFSYGREWKTYTSTIPLWIFNYFVYFRQTLKCMKIYLSCIVSWSVSNEQNCGPTFVGDVDKVFDDQGAVPDVSPLLQNLVRCSSI